MSMMNKTLTGLFQTLSSQTDETLKYYIEKDLPAYPTLARHISKKGYWNAPNGKWRIEKQAFNLHQIL